MSPGTQITPDVVLCGGCGAAYRRYGGSDWLVTGRSTAETNPDARATCPYCGHSVPLCAAAVVEPRRRRKRKAARGWGDIPP